MGLGGVVLSAGVVFTVAEVKASSRLAQKFETHRIDLPLPSGSDQEAVRRGEHLVQARYACNACHGKDFGGGVMIEDPAIGSIRGPNLTRGKGGKTIEYTMADWDRIVRHGVLPNGSPAVMPSEDYFKMSDQELSDVVAYIQSLPPVNSEVPGVSFGPVGTFLVAFKKFPISAELQHKPNGPHSGAPPETQDNAEFGAHLAAVCTGCHRPNLAGGKLPFGPPDWPAASNLTQKGLAGWTYEDFERAITLGLSKDGRKLKAPMTDVMPAMKAARLRVTTRRYKASRGRRRPDSGCG